MAVGIPSPTKVTPSRSFSSFNRPQEINVPTQQISRMSLLPFEVLNYPAPAIASLSTSPSSAPNTPTCDPVNGSQLYQRPSTLHGLKHKLHTTTVANSKGIHATTGSAGVPNRRKSVGHIPLSPLARTPSPLPVPASPTRSPSPLAFPTGHQPGSSNTTQSYSPGVTPSGIIPLNAGATKKSFVRPKSSEPSSPLLRRALSPDRLHPRSAENKCSLISPLCSNVPIKNQLPVSGVWGSSNAVSTILSSNNQCMQDNVSSKNDEIDGFMSGGLSSTGLSSNSNNNNIHSNNGNGNGNQSMMPLSFSNSGELLPRIAEEKDSTSVHASEVLTSLSSDTIDKCSEKKANFQMRKKSIPLVTPKSTTGPLGLPSSSSSLGLVTSSNVTTNAIQTTTASTPSASSSGDSIKSNISTNSASKLIDSKTSSIHKK